MIRRKGNMGINDDIELDFLKEFSPKILEAVDSLEKEFDDNNQLNFEDTYEHLMFLTLKPGLLARFADKLFEKYLVKSDFEKIDLYKKIVFLDEKIEVKESPLKIWLDDLRSVPDGYVGVHSVNEAITLVEKIEKENRNIEVLDLDHDLGEYAIDGGDGIKLLDYLVENEKYYPIKIHTANPVGRDNMFRMIRRFWPEM